MRNDNNKSVSQFISELFDSMLKAITTTFNAATSSDTIKILSQTKTAPLAQTEADLVNKLDLHFMNRLYYIGKMQADPEYAQELHKIIDDLQRDIGKIHAAAALSVDAFVEALTSYLKKYEVSNSVVNTKNPVKQGKRANLLHRYNVDADTAQAEVLNIRKGLEAFRKSRQ